MFIERTRSQVVLEVEYEALGLSSIHGLIDQYYTGFDKQDICLAVVVSEQEIFNWDNCRRPVEELSTLIVILNLKFSEVTRLSGKYGVSREVRYSHVVVHRQPSSLYFPVFIEFALLPSSTIFNEGVFPLSSL